MRKFCLWSVVACIIAGTGCVKEKEVEPEPNTFTSITAVVENGKNYDSLIEEAGAIIYSDEADPRRIKSVAYQNGSFTIDFPETVNDKYLSQINIADGITVSDVDAKWASVEFGGYQSGQYIGVFYNAKLSKSIYTEAAFLYVDRDCTIKGSHKKGTITESYNVILKKGWNIIYGTDKGNSITYISKNPGGLKWYYKSKKTQ